MKKKCKCGNNKFFLEKKKIKIRTANGIYPETVGTLVCTLCGNKESEWSE